MKNPWRQLVSVGLLLEILAGPCAAVQNFLSSDFDKHSATAEYFTDLDTTIVVTTNTESWFALVNLVANNTTTRAVQLRITLHESLSAVPDVLIQPSVPPGLWTVQLPKQYQGNDLGLGSHTFRVLVGQDTNQQVIYQDTSYLGLFNNTGTGGVSPSVVTGPATSIDRDLAVWDGTAGNKLLDPGFWSVTLTGDLVTPGGNLGIGTATPTLGRIQTESAAQGMPSLYATCTGARTIGDACTQIVNTTTSGVGSIFKSAQNIGVSGIWNGTDAHAIGTFYDVDGGTNNDAIYVQEGNIVIPSSGRIGVGDSTPDYLIEAEDTSGAILPLGVTISGARATTAGGAVIANTATGGDGASFKTGLQITNGGSYNGVNVAVLASASGGTVSNVAFGALSGDFSTADGSMSIIDNTNAVGADIYCTASPNQCLRVTSNDGTTGITALCSSTNGGPDCLHAQVTNSGTGGTAQAASLEANGNASGDTAIGLSISAGGASTNYGENVIAGDVVWGAINTLEDMHWYQNTSQIVMNVDSGASSNAGNNFLEVHGAPGKIALEAISTDAGGVGVASSISGAIVTASTANTFSNSQTSGTASINKTAAQFASTGTWNGSGAINSGITSSATGGTENFAFWGLNGGIRNAGLYVDDAQTESVADNGGGSNATLTLSVTKSFVIVTCNDAQGCDITMDETGIRAGTRVTIQCTGGAGACNFADTGGVSELAGTFAAGDNDTISMIHNGTAWIETGRSNN